MNNCVKFYLFSLIISLVCCGKGSSYTKLENDIVLLNSPHKHDEVGIHNLPDKLLILWWQTCLSWSTHLEFYKVSKKYYSLLRPNLRRDLIEWSGDRPLLRILEIYQFWIQATGKRKREFKRVLLLSKDVCLYEKVLFKDALFKMKKVKLTERCALMYESGRTRMRLLLEHHVDPEVVAVLMEKHAGLLLANFYHGFDPYWLIHHFGETERGKAVIQQMLNYFSSYTGPKSPLFSSSNPYTSKLSYANFNFVLKITSTNGTLNLAALKIAMAQLKDNPRLGLVFDHYPEKSISLDMKVLKILYERGFPIAKVIRSTKSVSVGRKHRISDKFKEMLAKYCAGNEQFAGQVIASLEVQLASNVLV